MVEPRLNIAGFLLLYAFLRTARGGVTGGLGPEGTQGQGTGGDPSWLRNHERKMTISARVANRTASAKWLGRDFGGSMGRLPRWPMMVPTITPGRCRPAHGASE